MDNGVEERGITFDEKISATAREEGWSWLVAAPSMKERREGMRREEEESNSVSLTLFPFQFSCFFNFISFNFFYYFLIA